MAFTVIEASAYAGTALAALAEIPEPPERLWVRGTLPDAQTKKLAVVGSRALTPYGRHACETLIGELAGYPVSIVSGLAFGADAAAHRAALASGLHTIAIPGSGLADRVIAPQTNLGLAKQILKAGGALVSEHPPGESARPYYFPARNRIMAGLADAVLMIEAGERSGTLITARLAADYNRELLCVPHRIGDPNSAGNHRFLRLGATLAARGADILEALGIEERAREIRQEPLAEGEAALYALLKDPLPKDELIRRSGLPAGAACTHLLALELKGIVHERFGAWRRVQAMDKGQSA